MTNYERQFIRNLTRFMFTCDFNRMPIESITSWTQRTRHWQPEGHYQYASCLKEYNALDQHQRLCQKPIGDKCLGPVDKAMQNNCHIYMERIHLAVDGRFVEDMEGFPPIQTYMNCSKPIRDAAKDCLPYLLHECKTRPIKVSKIIRGNMSSMIDILQDFPKLKIIHLIRDPRAIVMSIQNWFPRRVPINFSREARGVCTKMAEDIRRRQEVEKRYPGSTMEVLYDNIAANPMENIAAMYEFAGIDMTENTTAKLKQITTESGKISKKWQTQISEETKQLIDAECLDVYKITPYEP